MREWVGVYVRCICAGSRSKKVLLITANVPCHCCSYVAHYWPKLRDQAPSSAHLYPHVHTFSVCIIAGCSFYTHSRTQSCAHTSYYMSIHISHTRTSQLYPYNINTQTRHCSNTTCTKRNARRKSKALVSGRSTGE